MSQTDTRGCTDEIIRARSARRRTSMRSGHATFWLLALLSAACRVDTQSEGSETDAVAPLTTVALGATPVAPPRDAFVGASACASCHADQYNVWETSTHGTA